MAEQAGGAGPAVASDLEGTLTAGITWRAMRNYLTTHGYARRYRAFFWPRLPQLLRYRLRLVDERAFKEQWLTELLRLYRGFSRAAFQDMAEWVVANELWPQRRQAVVTELRRYQQSGCRVIIISGLFEPILDVFVRQLGQMEAMGTSIVFDGDTFTGEIRDGLNVGERKVARLRAFAADDGLIEAAYGDTKRDIPMLSMSRHPVAVYPDETLRETALARGWRVLES